MEQKIYLDEMQPFEARARDLVARMTLEEAAGQLRYDALPVPHLGVKRYNWWNEALHGVARAGMATVFPQAIGLAATFDPALTLQVAETIAEEARAKYNQFQAEGDEGIYKGLTFWSPNVNIFRDPRWGRGQETYGEDPYLTARMGVSFVRGLQGDDPRYLKAAACAKHFAVHSGPEHNRHSFDAKATAKDMAQTYLPAFEALVKEARVAGIMGAYNRTNGEPCCGSPTLMGELLFKQWGFEGYFVSDCWAIADFHMYHQITPNAMASAALALKNGCHMNCGNTYLVLLQAKEQGLVTEEEIREAAVRVMTIRMRLGMFDHATPWDDVPYDVVACRAHEQLNLETARRSLVLLKNDGLLPLNPKHIQNVAVIGPNANSEIALQGNYHGTANRAITVLEGIREALPAANVTYAQGCHLYKDKLHGEGTPDHGESEAVIHAKRADVVVLCVGLDETIEGEEMQGSEWTGDRKDLLLPKAQRALIERVVAVGKPVVLVNLSGSAIDFEEAGLRANAIVQAWYPGAQGGRAVAELILGAYSPSGRLPVTFYHNADPLPDFEDYGMAGRTYKYLERAPLFPFGFGLSYTRFAYEDLVVTVAKDAVLAEVTVRNMGDVQGEEVVQAYLRHEDISAGMGHHQLCGLARVVLAPGEATRVTLSISQSALETVTASGKRVIKGGAYTLYVGGSQPDERSQALGAPKPGQETFQLTV